MFEKIFSILLLLFSTLISNIDHKINKDFKRYDNVIKDNKEDKILNSNFSNNATNNDVIMSLSEIEQYNEKIKSRTNTDYDIRHITSVTSSQILSYIKGYTIPELPQYNGSSAISKSDIDKILDNCNIDNIKDLKPIKGIIVKRANLKSFPTDMHFYSQKNNKFDNLQESELHINTPVLIIHQSKDKLWSLVISPFYVGWVKNSHIGYATDEDFTYFLDSPNFIVITDVKVVVNNEILDMSVRLPYISSDTSHFKAVIPVKGSNNNITKVLVDISKEQANVGYLPYTADNVLKQAYKYKGVKYSWGSMDDGVDCSSYVANIYRTFGIMFPRNTSSQKDSVGTIISLNNKTNNQKLELIDKTEPSLLFQKGHVMLYIGVKNNKHYIIHANGTDMKVAMTPLEESKYLSNIDRVVLVK